MASNTALLKCICVTGHLGYHTRTKPLHTWHNRKTLPPHGNMEPLPSDSDMKTLSPHGSMDTLPSGDTMDAMSC